MTRSTDALIRELAHDLPAVAPLARLRTTLVKVMLVFMPFAAAWIIMLGLRPDLRTEAVHDPTFLAVTALLILMSAGGLVACLAEAVPGRDAAARGGLAIAGVGASAALIAPIVLFVASAEGFDVVAARSGLHCALGACALAIPAVVICARYISRGAPSSGWRAFALASLGTVALAAVIVHLTCPHPDPSHLVVGHGLAPLAAGALALAGLAVSSAIGSQSDRSAGPDARSRD